MINPDVIVVSYIASLGALAADKFASEIGILGPKPLSLLTMRPAKRGVSGAVTLLGFAAGMLGSFMMSIALYQMGNFAYFAVIIVASGTIGNIVDSIFGYYEEKGYGSKYTSNIMCALAGWISCLAMLL